MPADTLVIMLKEPNFGRVKTRLAADIGTLDAVWWYRHQTKRLIRRLSMSSRWQTVLAVSPDYAGLNSRVWPEKLPKIAQGRGDLGTRMRAVFMRFPRQRVVLIGSDIPEISTQHIARAFQKLGHARATIGSAPDGGYWSIGLAYHGKQLAPGFLRNVRWSSAFAMQDTVASLPSHEFARLDTLRDIDTAQDLIAARIAKNGAG